MSKNKPLPKTRRKDALRDRAFAYAERRALDDYVDALTETANAYEDGYRAAMRDARAAWASEDSHTMASIALLDFLKPLK